MTRNFLSITDLTADEILHLLNSAKELKNELKNNKPQLPNKNLIMIFEKPSLRTRLSFEIGMNQLGGHAVYLAPDDIGLGVRESVSDIAKVASSMGNCIMARTFKHQTISDLAVHANVPVINGLSDKEHPCQTLADLLTMYESKGTIQGLKIAFIGDGENNVAHSLCLGAAMLGASFTCASPLGYKMNPEIVTKAKKIAKTTRAEISETDNPKEAVENADVVYTDTWVSMGDEAEKETRLQTFSSYQVTQSLMKYAKEDAIFLHDLPAYRGNEVTAEVIDGSQSAVFQQAENRLHAQKALLVYLLHAN